MAIRPCDHIAKKCVDVRKVWGAGGMGKGGMTSRECDNEGYRKKFCRRGRNKYKTSSGKQNIVNGEKESKTKKNEKRKKEAKTLETNEERKIDKRKKE